MRLTFLEETFHCQKIVVMLKNKRQKRKQKNHVTQEAYSEPYNDVSRVFLGRLIHTLNPGKRHHDWHSGKKRFKISACRCSKTALSGPVCSKISL